MTISQTGMNTKPSKRNARNRSTLSGSVIPAWRCFRRIDSTYSGGLKRPPKRAQQRNERRDESLSEWGQQLLVANALDLVVVQLAQGVADRHPLFEPADEDEDEQTDRHRYRTDVDRRMDRGEYLKH